MTAPSQQVFDRIFKGLAAELRAEDVTVRKTAGWKERGRDGTFDPRAVVEHHTGSAKTSGNAPCLGIVTYGRSDVPGPLSQFLIGRDGTIYFIAAGRCNHAGYGGPTRGIPKDSGNAYSIGVECENDGRGEEYSKEQRRAMGILSAILLRRMRRTAFYNFGHKEWTSRKIDPTFDMNWWRTFVRKKQKRLYPKWWKRRKR